MRTPRNPRRLASHSLATFTLALAGLAGLAACTGGGSEITPALSPLPAVALIDEETGRPLGDAAAATLDRRAAGADAGTLLARSPDGLVCVFADGRDGHNRAAC